MKAKDYWEKHGYISQGQRKYYLNFTSHCNHRYECYSPMSHKTAWVPGTKRTSTIMHVFIQFLATHSDYPNALDDWLTWVVVRANGAFDPPKMLDQISGECRLSTMNILDASLVWSDTPLETQWIDLNNEWRVIAESIRATHWKHHWQQIREGNQQ